MEKGDIIPIKFNGKNYMNWVFPSQKSCGRSRAVLGYVDGTVPKSNTDAIASKTTDKNH